MQNNGQNIHRAPESRAKSKVAVWSSTFTVVLSGNVEKGFSHLNFAQEVSECHVVLNDEVSVDAFGGDAALLLHRRAVVDPGAAGVLLDPSGGRGFRVTCRKGARECGSGRGSQL